MRTLMKKLTLLIAISLLPTYSLAGEFDEQINKACLRHAVSLVAKLKNNVINDMSSSQSDEALKVATESCQAYFKSEFNRNSETVAATAVEKQNVESAEESSSILDVLLNSEVKRKPGNERLKKHKR
jgi:hypothetical protein